MLEQSGEKGGEMKRPFEELISQAGKKDSFCRFSARKRGKGGLWFHRRRALKGVNIGESGFYFPDPVSCMVKKRGRLFIGGM